MADSEWTAAMVVRRRERGGRACHGGGWRGGGSQAASLGVKLAVDHVQLVGMAERELGFEDFKSKTFAALCIVLADADWCSNEGKSDGSAAAAGALVGLGLGTGDAGTTVGRRRATEGGARHVIRKGSFVEHDYVMLKLTSSWLFQLSDEFVRGAENSVHYVSRDQRCKFRAFIDQLHLLTTVRMAINDEGHHGVCGEEWQSVSININTVHNLIILFLDKEGWSQMRLPVRRIIVDGMERQRKVTMVAATAERWRAGDGFWGLLDGVQGGLFDSFARGDPASLLKLHR
ncbi:hypothetical protein NL676_007165 [Syzygium grande]|nr:hypothetical protein NL676_007165 [Syzygium grande]